MCKAYLQLKKQTNQQKPTESLNCIHGKYLGELIGGGEL